MPTPTDDKPMGDWLPVDDLRCPICGATIKWNCSHQDDGWGSAECQDGRSVSRRFPGIGSACRWRGTKTYRHADKGVFVKLPIPTECGPK